MQLKKLEDVNLSGKTILYRAPYDIDVEEVNSGLELVDDMRIRATIPTLKYLLKENCKIVILNYVGRPDGKVVENLRATPHAKRLAELLGHPVDKVDDCIGQEVDERVSQMKKGDILMLENVRFHPEEMTDDDEFAKKLCKGKDLVVFDGFPQALRVHASTTGIERHLPSVAGLYLRQEVAMLSGLLDNPKHPFTVIIGGAKISDKINIIISLLSKADTVMVGGGAANIFLKASGMDVGGSFVEDVFVDEAKREKRDLVEVAGEILEQAKGLGKEIVLPRDLVITDGEHIENITNGQAIRPQWMALDIGHETIKEFSKIISESKTVFMSGPVGKFEDERFSHGSKVVIEALRKLKDLGGETVIAGGDTINLVREYGDLSEYSHVSLAGGSTLQFLAGKELPALLPLTEKSL